jgi:hypothetical protein
MKYTLYKPNSKNAGSAFAFNIGLNKGKPSLYINAVLQASWNDTTKTGSFKENAKDPQKSATVMLNANEAGEILSSLKSRIPVVFFHKTPNGSSVIKFSPWDKDRVIKDQGGDKTYKSPAFGLSFSKDSTSQFKIALEAGETEVLALLLQDLINQSLFAAAQYENESESPVQPSQKEEKKQETAPDEDYDDVPF